MAACVCRLHLHNVQLTQRAEKAESELSDLRALLSQLVAAATPASLQHHLPPAPLTASYSAPDTAAAFQISQPGTGPSPSPPTRTPPQPIAKTSSTSSPSLSAHLKSAAPVLMLTGQPGGQHSLTVLKSDRHHRETAPATALECPMSMPALGCKVPALPQTVPKTLSSTHQLENCVVEDHSMDSEHCNRASQAETADMQLPTKPPLAKAHGISKTQLTQLTHLNTSLHLGNTESLPTRPSSPALLLSARRADQNDSNPESAPPICKTSPLAQFSLQICHRKIVADAISPTKAAGTQCSLTCDSCWRSMSQSNAAFLLYWVKKHYVQPIN